MRQKAVRKDALFIEISSEEEMNSILLSHPPLFQSDSLVAVGSPADEEIQVLLGLNAFLHINSHCKADISHEVGGFLIGSPYTWENKIYVEISDAISITASSSSTVHLSIPLDAWTHATIILREKYPDSYVVGWYHTHPNMQIFLSAQDIRIHKGFFRETWQVALVLDPIKKKADFFVWDNGQIRRSQGYQVHCPADISFRDIWIRGNEIDH